MVKQAGWCLLMSGKAEQRYSILQGQCLDNATQMGQDELSILTCYVTPSAVIVFRPCAHGCWIFATVYLNLVFLYVVVRETVRRQGVFVFCLNKIECVCVVNVCVDVIFLKTAWFGE